MRLRAAGVLALAAVLRVAGLDFGLPLAEARPDEMTIAYQAMKFGSGDLDPRSFNYPTLFKYLCFGIYGGYYGVGRALGWFADQHAFLVSFFANDAAFRLLPRLLSAAMGVAGVALVARLPGGWTSALFLSVAFLHVRDSHFGVTDVTMTTLATLAVVLAREAAATGSRQRLLGAAVAAGLAASTKYNGGVAVLPVAWAAWRLGGPRAALATAATAVASFVAGSPFVLLDAATFVRDFGFELRHLGAGQHVDVGVGWVHHAVRTLPTALGGPLYLAALAGAALHLRRDRADATLLYAFPLAYFVLIGNGETAFYRYALPIVPFLAVAAGDLVASRAPRVGLLLAVPTLLASLQADRLFLAEDTRESMGRWIEANVPTDATIVHAGTFTGAPMLQRNVANQVREAEGRAGRADASGFRDPRDLSWYVPGRPAYDVLYVSKRGIASASQVDLADVTAQPPPFLELEEYPLEHYAAVPAELRALAAARYRLVHEERSHEPPGAGGFDQQDAFYMPVSGFAAYTRMGPNLALYARVDP